MKIYIMDVLNVILITMLEMGFVFKERNNQLVVFIIQNKRMNVNNVIMVTF